MKAKDIAKKLGISPAAVSLALNGKPGVSEKTRKLVIAEAYGNGNPKMRYLAEVQSNISIRFVIFVDDGATAAKETSFHASILQGIEMRAKNYNYNVLVSYFHTSSDWSSQIDQLSKDVSGIILLATDLKEEHIKRATDEGISALKIPLVIVDNASDNIDLDSVYGNNYKGAKSAVTHLLETGHRDVGYIRSELRISNFHERERGFKRARQEFGIPKEDASNIINVPISSDGAYAYMSKWLDTGNKPVSAYFVENDIIAAACIKALREHGYNVPDDVSIVGFDDIPLSSLIDPPLTTVSVMIETIGVQALNILHQRIKEGGFALCDERIGSLRVSVQPHLVCRESVKKL